MPEQELEFPFAARFRHLTLGELLAGLPEIEAAPKSEGKLLMVVVRPGPARRQELQEGFLDLEEGLIGDSWKSRGSSNPEKSAGREMQVTIMNAGVIDLIAQERARWPLAGDQLYVDLDLSTQNTPPGTQLCIGGAILEVTPALHGGCQKFATRFGTEAKEFVNSDIGRRLNLRGVNARVLQGGFIRVGDPIEKITG